MTIPTRSNPINSITTNKNICNKTKTRMKAMKAKQ